MTSFLEYGFLELPFLEDEFLAGVVAGSDGFQAAMVIDSNPARGFQAEQNVLDFPNVAGMQANQIIVEEKFNGFETFATKQIHINHPVFLIDDFLTTPFLDNKVCVVPGMQANQVIDVEPAYGFQSLMVIEDDRPVGFQALQIIDDDLAVGFEADQTSGVPVGFQVRVNLYNTRNLRILCEFPSRGDGTNWTASSTAAGDFDVNNLNSDIVEKVWRSAGLGTVQITCDTQVVQGVPIDTLGILGANFSSGAIVNFAQSDDPTFSSIPFSTNLQIVNDENFFWIADTLPLDQWRYVRFTIDDNGNSDGHYQIGSIVFGSSAIFQGECFTDVVDFGFNDFALTVPTLGYTNVSNSQAIRKFLGLNFRSLNSTLGNFQIIRDLATTFRTTHKCLWIPTPSATNQDITRKFAMFSKLVQPPRESHKSVDDSQDYISFDINLDESL